MSVGVDEDTLWSVLGRPAGAPASRRLALRWPTRDDVIAWSSGRIDQTETVHHQTWIPIEGGLFCETIFDAVPRRADRRADLYGACRTEAWHTRYGHIELGTAVPHPWWPDPAGAPLLEVLPVMPPALRPMFPIHPETRSTEDLGDRPVYRCSDLNELYLWILRQNRRARGLAEAGHVELARDYLRHPIDALLQNEQRTQPRQEKKRVLSSLASMLGSTPDDRWRGAMALDDHHARDAGALPRKLYEWVTAIHCAGFDLSRREPSPLTHVPGLGAI